MALLNFTILFCVSVPSGTPVICPGRWPYGWPGPQRLPYPSPRTALGVAALRWCWCYRWRYWHLTIPFASACRQDADNLVPDVVWFAGAAAFALSIAAAALGVAASVVLVLSVALLNFTIPFASACRQGTSVIWFGMRVITRFRHRRFHRLWRNRFGFVIAVRWRY